MTETDAPPGLEACAFDAYGTLFDFASAVMRHRDEIGTEAAAVSALWRTKQVEYTWQRSLRGDYADFWHITGDALDYALAAHGITDAALRSRLMEAYFTLDAFPEVGDVLSRMQGKGLKLAILSNGSPSMLIAAVRHNDLYARFEKLLSVDAVGVYKPHPDAYRLAVDHFRLPAERIAFVSANGWDAAGGAHFGFRVAWVNRAGAPPEQLSGSPEWEIPSLDALPRALGVA
jgi:2-haloacid dehalogenase